ncbi:MAG: hypothetical protein B1H04_04285 [Planctomycetales bacterium 4484_123]|nr:MAG: hypothetical protein B1H04_04285 [Planctomycetales bacterium 4484_123]
MGLRVSLFVVGVCAACMPAAEREQAGAASAVKTILNVGSYWRCHAVWASERVRLASGELVLRDACFVRRGRYGWQRRKKSVEAATVCTPLPPANWREVDFDDSTWPRFKGPVPAGTREIALLALRGKFMVADPARAGELRLSLGFRGGTVVYVNGREVARSHLPAGELQPLTCAEDYPKEAYLNPEGFVLRRGFGDPRTYADRFRLRRRDLTGVRIPARLLRKGVNVLAIELHRAPTAEVLLTGKPVRHSKNYCWWAMLAFEGLELTAPASSTVVPNVARPAGLQLWNHPVTCSVQSGDYGETCEPVRPVSIIGVRNGTHSGQIVLGCDGPVKGLEVRVTELRPAGRGRPIPASAVKLRYGLLGQVVEWGTGGRYPRGTRRFEGLTETPPRQLEPAKGQAGVTLPIWLTVRVPKDATPGEYAGSVTVAAAGHRPLTVPVKLKVHAWTAPDPAEFTSHLGLVQSPESLAMKYKVPMWSQRHWKLIEQSFRLLGQVGDKVVFIPLLRQTHLGNEHSMVRWIRRTDGAFKHDFSIVERYVAVAARYLKRPPVVCLYIWEPYTGSSYLGHAERQGSGMLYTLLDPATGKLTGAEGPRWGSQEVREFWQPVVAGVRRILAAHGLAGSMMFGVAGDSRPNKAAVEDLRAVAPDVPWVVHSHARAYKLHGQPVGYLADVWGAPVAPDPAQKHLYGWKSPFLRVTFPRAGSNTVGTIRTAAPPLRYRLALEGALSAGIHGMGRMGADFWNLIPGRYNRLWPLLGRYRISSWAQLTLANSTAYVLFPAPGGPVATVRLEMLREGSQEAEAKVFIERALTDQARRAALGDQLARRAQGLLDERIRALLRTRSGADINWLYYLSSGFQRRSDQLFALAAEVAAKSARTATSAPR